MLHKRVLYLITKATWGGAQRYVYDLATHLPRDIYEPFVAFGQKGKLSNDLNAVGIKTRHLTSLGRDVAIISDVKSFFEIWRAVREIRPDIVHLNSSKAAALGALAARLAGVPKIVFTVHGWPFKEDRSPLWKMFVYKVSWFTAFLSHAVIVVSKSDETRGQRMLFVGKKVHYIPIGIEPPQFLSRDEASSALHIVATTPRIVTIAELTPNKGIRYAIGAVALLKQRGIDVSYFVISDGEECAALGALANETGVSDRVHFLGFIANAARYLKAFDVFVLPSIKEGMPYVLLEASIAHLPIITTNTVDPVFQQLAFDDMMILPGDSAALANAIVATLKENRERSELFSPISAMLEKTTELYQ